MKVVLLVMLALLLWAVVRALRNGRGATGPAALATSRAGKASTDAAHHSRQGQAQSGADGPGGYAG